MTNHNWSFSIEDTRKSLGLERLLFKNDFTALALSLPHLAPDDLHQIGGVEVQQKGALAVLGPGTGLGVSGLVRAGGGWIPIEGEGGHVSISPANRRECDILNVCWDGIPAHFRGTINFRNGIAKPLQSHLQAGRMLA